MQLASISIDLRAGAAGADVRVRAGRRDSFKCRGRQDDVSHLIGGRFAAERGAVASRATVARGIKFNGRGGRGQADVSKLIAACFAAGSGAGRCMVNWSVISVDID